jgi:hypothetical protein
MIQLLTDQPEWWMVDAEAVRPHAAAVNDRFRLRSCRVAREP